MDSVSAKKKKSQSQTVESLRAKNIGIGNEPGMVRFPRNLIMGVLTAAACLKTAVARILAVKDSGLLLSKSECGSSTGGGSGVDG